MMRFFLLAAAYFAAAYFGLRIPSVDAHITLIWLPTGIALAALLLWGSRLWPAVTLAAFCVNYSIAPSVPLAAGIAVGNTLGPLLAAYLLQRLGFQADFEHRRDIVLLFAVAAVSMMIPATGGLVSLYQAGALASGALGLAWLTWWLGDTIGVLLGAPLLLALTPQALQRLRRGWHELLAWLALSGACGWLVFLWDPVAGVHLPLAFLPVMLVAMLALRFGILGAAVSSLGFSLLAVFGTTAGHGPFFIAVPSLISYLIWAFMATCALTGLLITALQSNRTAMERTLRESEQKLRGLYELSPIGIAMTDMQGRYLEFNEAFIAICGYAEDELRQLDYWQLTPRDYEAAEARQLEQLLARGRYGPYEKEYIRKDGTRIPLVLNGALVHGRDGAQYIWSFVEDISERRHTQQQLEALLAEQKAMLENDIVGIVRTGNRLIQWASPAFEKMLGYAAGELAGRNTRVCYASDEAYEALGAAAYPFLSQGEVYHGQVEFVRKDGSLIWVDITGATLEGSPNESLWAFVDITERKKTQDDLTLARDAANAANVAKSQFLATMAHEIRTPLNGILGMAQILLQPGLDDAKRQEYVRIILGSGQVLLTLLNDILDLSRIEANKLELKQAVFQPEQLIAETGALFDEMAHGKQLRIETCWQGTAGARYQGDPIRLRQMLSNLLGNAIKFSTEGVIRLEGRELPETDGCTMLEFAVSDSGIGISEAQQARLFMPFSQIDASNTREYGGSGLGLSIVRRLALLMDGDVGVSSREGQGSRFWFRVRAGQAEDGTERRQSARAAPAGDGLQLAGKLVLVAEDNPTNRIVIEAMLKKTGVRVVCAGNGQEACERVMSGERPDLVLMDCQMPVMDGFAATQCIREWEQAQTRPRLPIIAVTASAFETDRQKCLAAGMDGFLPKPIVLAELVTTLTRHIGAAAQSGGH